MIPIEDEKEAIWGFTGIGIPAEVLLHPELTNTEMMLFGLIRNISQTSRGCWASNRWLGEFLRVQARTISQGVSNLNKYGFIKIRVVKKQGLTQETERRIYIDESYITKYRRVVEQLNEKFIPLANINKTPSEKTVGGYTKNATKEVKEEVKEDYKEKYKKEKNFSNLFPKQYQNNPSFISTWNDFVADRKERKIPVTERSAKIIANKAVKQCGTNIEKVINGLLEAIERGYRGVFFTTETNNTSNRQHKTETSSRTKNRNRVGCDPHERY